MAAIKSKAFNPNAKVYRECLDIWAAAVDGAARAEIDQMRKLQIAAANGEPVDAEKYLVLRQQRKAEMNKHLGATFAPPAKSAVSAYKGVVALHDMPYVKSFMDDCRELRVAQSFMVRLAVWCKAEFPKTGKAKPTSAGIIAKVKEFNALTNKSKANADKTRKAKAIEAALPRPQLQDMLSALTSYVTAFGDNNGFIKTAMRSLNGELATLPIIPKKKKKGK